MNEFINSALGAQQWVLLALVPPLILLLYFLKLRRMPLEVPSTYLWTRTIEDLHVNSIWQKLRKNLLLLLQLMVAILLLLACLRPGCSGEDLAGDRFVFLIDNSASMSAKDGNENGDTRLEEAKRQVRNLINRMKKGDVGMLISFSDDSDVLQSYTASKSQLKQKLKQIKQTERASDIREALVAASGLANPGQTSDKSSDIDIQVADAIPAKLYIYSDGAIAELPGFAFGDALTFEYHPIGSQTPPDNVGITAFSISNLVDSDNQVQAFARLYNCDDEDRVVDVSLFIDGELHDAQQGITVPENGSKNLSYSLTGVVANLEKALPVKLMVETKDIYQQDNSAYAVLNPPRLSNLLLVREYNQFLDFGLQTPQIKKLANIDIQPPSYLEDKKFETDAALGVYDLIIFDQCSPKAMPLSNTVFIGTLPPGDRWSAKEKKRGPIIDFDRSHPLMYSVTLDQVTVIESNPISGPSGWTRLVDTTDGTIMGIGPRGSFEDLILGFGIVDFDEAGEPLINTDWPRKLSFPLFIQNLVMNLGNAKNFSQATNARPGKLVTIKPQLPYPSIVVVPPAGSKISLRPRKDNAFVFSQTASTGIYRVEETETKETDQLFAVNLFDRKESNIRVKPELDLGFDAVEGTGPDFKPVRKEFWPWIVGFALAVLMIEWYIYNRRVFI